MKKVLGMVIFFVSSMFVAHYAEPTVLGSWKTIDDETGQVKSIVNIWVQNGVYYGTIKDLLNRKPGQDPDPVCDKCSGGYKNKKVKGMVIMWGLKKDGNEYSGGQILDPNNGKVYSCKIWPSADGKTLNVRGYVAMFFRTQTWHKVN